jgi:putative ABC transport system permease protein
MVLLQAIMVGVIGYGLGVGGAALMGKATGNTELAFLMPWQLLVLTGGAITVICLLSSSLSMIKVLRLEPGIVFKG